jgi:DeoR/GlpR family transcriptional regulator of sugar metabolism
MLAKQRQQRILELVQTAGGARVSDLVDLLGVSDMTVRRDISTLARKGKVARVHGGATALAGRASEEPGFATKFRLQKAEKAAIAKSAVALVEPGDSVAISGGTTTYAVAVELLSVRNLTVVTNSVPVGELLHTAGRTDLTVILTGGVRTPSDSLVGPIAVAALSTLHVDWTFLGVHGIDERAGLTTPNLVEAETHRAMVRSARRLAVVADSSKWDVVGLSSIAPLDDIDVLITDDRLSQDAQRILDSRVGSLVITSPTRDVDDASAETLA